jgi:GT2 family glycosyltransferase
MHLMFRSAPVWTARTQPCVDQPLWVDYVDGAFLAFRSKVLSDAGPLDEGHFLYAEDMEWCFRAQCAGWKVVVLPDIKVCHYQGSSSCQQLARALVHNAVNVSHFVGLIYGWQQARTAWRILLLGMLLRIPLAIARGSGLAGQYWQGFRRCLALSPNLRRVLRDQWPTALLQAEQGVQPGKRGERR